MKITKSYLEKLIREQVESALAESSATCPSGAAITDEASAVQQWMAVNPDHNRNWAKNLLAVNMDENPTAIAFVKSWNSCGSVSQFLDGVSALTKISQTGTSLSSDQAQMKARRARDQSTSLEESKKSENEIILEVHRNNRKLSPAVKNNWWQNA
jgi:hypothetical protein